jgi:diacylglycerol O-acyltransferase
MFWVPQSGDIGVGVSILSYNDAVQFSLISDRHFIPDPETSRRCSPPSSKRCCWRC